MLCEQIILGALATGVKSHLTNVQPLAHKGDGLLSAVREAGLQDGSVAPFLMSSSDRPSQQ
jgi:hypothetical protein